MGFFKNLFKGKFKKIAKNFGKNLKNGRLVKGTGFDSIINAAASPITSKASALLGGPDEHMNVLVPETGGIRGSIPPKGHLQRKSFDPHNPWTYNQGQDTTISSSSNFKIAGMSLTTIGLIVGAYFLLKKK